MKVNNNCKECGMALRCGEYHPYAACLMFKSCGNRDTVRNNLKDVLSHGKKRTALEKENIQLVRDNLRKRVEELEAERDAANAVAKAYVEQVDELEAKMDSVETEIDAMEIFEGNASRDCCCDDAVQWYAARLRSLLKENE